MVGVVVGVAVVVGVVVGVAVGVAVVVGVVVVVVVAVAVVVVRRCPVTPAVARAGIAMRPLAWDRQLLAALDALGPEHELPGGPRGYVCSGKHREYADFVAGEFEVR